MPARVERVCVGVGCDVVLVGRLPTALYCSMRCRKRAELARVHAREASRAAAARADVEPVRPPLVDVEGEPFWSRSFRSNVRLGQLAESRRIWGYRLAYGPEGLPSVLAVRAATNLKLEVPPHWVSSTSVHVL